MSVCSRRALTTWLAAACVATACAAGVARAQVQVSGGTVRVVGRGVETLKFELHAVHDEVLLYAGGPRELLLLDVRPSTQPPRVDISGGPNPTLRVRDLTLYDGTGADDQVYLDGDEYIEVTDDVAPESQTWEAELTALVPTDFFIDLEEGKGHLDLTDMHVRNLHVLSHLARVKVEFARQNDGYLERFQLHAEGGEVELIEFLNARPRSVTIQTNESKCDIQITGKPFEGFAEIYFTGVAEEMRFEVSRKIGVRIEGPPNTVARFDDKNLERRGLALYTKDYDKQHCQVLLHFAEDVKDIEVDWN